MAVIDRINVNIFNEIEDESASPGGGGVHVASIVHLTDLHLRLNSQMQPVTLDELGGRLALIRHLPKYGHGIEVANRVVTRHLPERVLSAIEIERTIGPQGLPIAVLQTGDVEAHGAFENEEFRGYRYLRERIKNEIDQDDAYFKWVDTYGNHDVWSTIWPAPSFSPGSHRLAVNLPDEFGSRWPANAVSIDSQVGPAVQIFRINSVLDSWALGDIFAIGEYGSHPRGSQTPKAAIDELGRTVDGQERPAIRILASHHPAVPLTNEARNSPSIRNRDEFCSKTPPIPIHLIVAGHRHKLDPPEFVELSVDRDKGLAPLPSGIGQLCADTPTQVEKRENSSRKSFSVYRVYLVENSNMLKITRLLYRSDPVTDAKPTVERCVFSGINL